MIYFFSGIIFFQITYILTQWNKYKRVEYIYYSLYLVFVIAYYSMMEVQNLAAANEHRLSYLIDLFKRPVVLSTFLWYVLFAQFFIDIRRHSSSLNKTVNLVKYITFAGIGLSFILYPVENAWIEFWSFNIVNVALLLLSLYVIFRLSHYTDKLSGYILKGSLCAIAGSLLTNIFNYLPELSGGRYSFSEHFVVFPSQIGLILETFFFTAGLSYKAFATEKEIITMQERLISQLSENQELLVEKQSIRNKIAQDLHDDIGATLSGIALTTHMVKEFLVQNKQDAALRSVGRIEESAVEMVNNLNDVVWSVNPKNDTVEQMMERLKEYVFAMADIKSIHTSWNVDESVREIKLPMECRKNIYLICKEAINNAVKYSGCREIIVVVEKVGAALAVHISDDGKGFDLSNHRKGNGLKNMRARAEENKFELDIKTGEAKGTAVNIFYQITQ
jgi:signal transduction histidine kinase